MAFALQGLSVAAGVLLLLACQASADVCADDCAVGCTAKFPGKTNNVSLNSCRAGCKLQNASAVPQDDVDEFCHTLPIPIADFHACLTAVEMLKECNKTDASKCLSKCSNSCSGKFRFQGDASLDSCFGGCTITGVASSEAVEQICQRFKVLKACTAGAEERRRCGALRQAGSEPEKLSIVV